MKEVKTKEQLLKLIEDIKKAQKEFATFSQEQVDKIFRAAATAANEQRIPLAKMAVAETGMGLVEDKIIKNHFASEYIYNKFKDAKTCGVIEKDDANGITKIAEPIGVIAGVIPTTNPTSTAIFKALIALKTRNGIVFSPHPRAKGCTIAAAKIVLDAAVKAGAPEGIIGWIDVPSLELTQVVMAEADLILATGGPGMVKSAYSSGKPAIGVGAGNTPAIVDDSADIKMAVNSILLSKSFDNGVICASEQTIIAVEKVYEEVKKELIAQGAYLLVGAEREKVAKLMIVDGHLNGAIVGQSAYKIAEMAGVKVPKETKALVGEALKVTADESFAYEKLSPILGLYKAKTFEKAVATAVELIEFGGLGHTSSLYVDDAQRDKIDFFASQVKTGRTLVNTPSSHGAIGDIYNFKLAPSLTLGCGSWGGNSVSENIGVKHLINIKTVAERRENMLWYQVPSEIYFKNGCLELALGKLTGKKKAVVVTDKALYELGFTTKITTVLDKLNIAYEIFSDVAPDPTLSTVAKGVEICNKFQPDVIISVGGGSPMDAAKIMWLMYEDPNADFASMAMRFMDIQKRIYQFPELGRKAMMVSIPTSSGTGAEVTPFAVITDDTTDPTAPVKYPIADYALTPNMAIIDPDLVMTMPKNLCAWSGLDVLTHAIEAYVSVFATEFTNSHALEAIKLVFKYLPSSYKNGDKESRGKMHYASALAGMAFANAFLGVCHSLAHKLGSMFHVPHGLANALLLNETIRFNATDCPRKVAAFSQYKFPEAKQRYAQIADMLNLGGKTNDEKVENLIKAIEKLKAEVEIIKSIEEWGKDHGFTKKDFLEKLDVMSEQAFDDQCTGANPRYPSIEELKELYLNAFEGK